MPPRRVVTHDQYLALVQSQIGMVAGSMLLFRKALSETGDSAMTTKRMVYAAGQLARIRRTLQGIRPPQDFDELQTVWLRAVRRVDHAMRLAVETHMADAGDVAAWQFARAMLEDAGTLIETAGKMVVEYRQMQGPMESVA